MRQKRPVTEEELFNARVVVNTSVRTDDRGRELVVVVPRKRTWALNILAFLLPMPREKRLVLDELGREVYEDCARGLTVGRIISNFQERHRISEEHSRKSVLTYLRNLTQRGIIGLAMESSQGSGEEKKPRL